MSPLPALRGRQPDAAPVFDAGNRFRGKVFCIGANKTGTTSLEHALRHFGYDLGPQARGEMLDAECHRGDYDRLIRFCDLHEAFQDVPFSKGECYKALDAAFPGSRFILTVRDSGEQWFSSLCRFHTKAYSSGDHLPTEEDLKRSSYAYRGMAYDNYVRYFDYPNTPLYDKERYIAFYETRNQAVMEYFKDRPDQLLVLNTADNDAFHKLGAFLNVDVPQDAPFPWLNKT